MTSSYSDREQEVINAVWSRVNLYRQLRGMSWSGLGKAIDSGSIYERRGKNLTVSTIAKMAEAFDVPVEELLGDTDERKHFFEDTQGWAIIKKRITGTVIVEDVFMDYKEAESRLLRKGLINIPNTTDSFVDPSTGETYQIKSTHIKLNGTLFYL